MQGWRSTPYVEDYFPYTKGQLNRLGNEKASEYLRKKVENGANQHWDKFYRNNGAKFFKKRHWITREFVELRESNPNERYCLCEIGCGTGATCKYIVSEFNRLVIPLLESFNPNLRIIAFDLSQHAINIINTHPLCTNPRYDGQITAFVYDATSELEQDIPNVPSESVDCM
jgi:hypothetical protein